MRGRKKTPTAVSKLRGHPGRRPRNTGEPKPPKGKPPGAPPWLSAEAKREWKRIAPTMHRLNMLTELDRGGLAAYCESYAIVVEERRHWRAAKDPETKKASRIAFMDAMRQMRSFLSELGLSPSSRTRIVGTSVIAGKAAHSPLGDLQQRALEAGGPVRVP